MIPVQVSAVAVSSLWAVFGVSIGELGSGGTVGFVLGYVLKKLIRLVMYVAAIITGLNLAFLYWLQSVGILTVTFNPDRLSAVLEGFLAWGTAQLGSLVAFASGITLFGAGFAGGILLGFSKG
jgi:uncharacterized membrane protein (Fun14 family)